MKYWFQGTYERYFYDYIHHELFGESRVLNITDVITRAVTWYCDYKNISLLDLGRIVYNDPMSVVESILYNHYGGKTNTIEEFTSTLLYSKIETVLLPKELHGNVACQVVLHCMSTHVGKYTLPMQILNFLEDFKNKPEFSNLESSLLYAAFTSIEDIILLSRGNRVQSIEPPRYDKTSFKVIYEGGITAKDIFMERLEFELRNMFSRDDVEDTSMLKAAKEYIYLLQKEECHDILV